MVVFSFLNFFCFFLEFSNTSWVGTHWNDFFLFLFFFSSLSRPSQLILAWKEATMVFFYFFEFFCYFFWIFYFGLGRNSLERSFFSLSYSAFPNLFSLFLGLPQHILPRKAAIIVFSIFLEFSITGRVGTPRNDFFFFFCFFLGHSQLILGWKVAKMLVFNFLNFFAIFF